MDRNYIGGLQAQLKSLFNLKDKRLSKMRTGDSQNPSFWKMTLQWVTYLSDCWLSQYLKLNGAKIFQ